MRRRWSLGAWDARSDDSLPTGRVVELVMLTFELVTEPCLHLVPFLADFWSAQNAFEARFFTRLVAELPNVFRWAGDAGVMMWEAITWQEPLLLSGCRRKMKSGFPFRNVLLASKDAPAWFSCTFSGGCRERLSC